MAKTEDGFTRVNHVVRVFSSIAFFVVCLSPMVQGFNPRTNAEKIDISSALTLFDCIEIAQKNATSIKTAKLDLITSDYRIQDARANYRPRIDVDGRYNFSDRIEFGWEEENYDAGINARYTIWDHGRRKAYIAQAKANKDAMQHRYERLKQQTIFDVIDAYYNLLEVEKLVDVDEKALEQSIGNVEKVKAFVKSGYLIEADIATAEVRQASDELTLLGDQNSLNIAKARLARRMGLDPTTSIDVVDDPDYERYMKTGVILTEEVTIEDCVSVAFSNRPELSEMEAELTSQKWTLDLARSRHLPELTAHYNFNVNLDDYLRERENFKQYRSWDAMARVTFPLFDSGIAKRNVLKAENNLQRLREYMDDLKWGIVFSVQQAYLDLKRAEKAMEIADKQVKNARLSLDVITARFEQNLVILLELLDAQTAYAQALTNRVKAFYDYKVAKSALQKAMGVLE